MNGPSAKRGHVLRGPSPHVDTRRRQANGRKHDVAARSTRSTVCKQIHGSTETKGFHRNESHLTRRRAKNFDATAAVDFRPCAGASPVSAVEVRRPCFADCRSEVTRRAVLNEWNVIFPRSGAGGMPMTNGLHQYNGGERPLTPYR
jgi:hypothetical protein